MGETMKIAFVSFKKTKNIGDLFCSPAHYFYFSKSDAEEPVHVHVNDPMPSTLFDLAIFGGGAMGGLMLQRDMARKVNARTRVAWGIGRSAREWARKPAMPRNGLDFIGVRDWSRGMKNWLPCVSCMHPAFHWDSHAPEPTREVVGFLNAAQPLRTLPGVKHVMMNEGVVPTEVARFLRSGALVVTNSYHGAYWAQLLNRPVVIVGAYSSKFYFFKRQPPVTQTGDWRALARQARAYGEEPINEAVHLNMEFHGRILERIHG
jgi:hypothetical protein